MKLTNRLKKYNEYKFTITPSHKFMGNLSWMLSPLMSISIISVIISCFVAYITFSDPSYIVMNKWIKAKAVANVVMLLWGIITLFSYVYTFFTIHMISWFKKHKTDEKFVWTCHFITLFFSILFAMIFLEDKNYGYLGYIVPAVILLTGTINTYAYKFINELFKRDENGKLILYNQK